MPRRAVVERWQGAVRVLTGAVDVRSRVAGLDLGADDYLPKPFAFEELVARVPAPRHRSGPAAPPGWPRPHRFGRGPSWTRSWPRTAVPCASSRARVAESLPRRHFR
ncbi:hypothetical protein [Saccharothrix luteola]|uniref:hypothetical protein n=1 Tax=Saccharothrix luteola TaxID=2893018 RepID=UPI0035575C69